MDPILNCVIGACCPDGSEAQATALTAFIAARIGCTLDEARPYAVLMLETFDFAEKGTLAPLVASISRLARGPKYAPES